MNGFDFFNHLFNFALPAFGVALVLAFIVALDMKRWPVGLWFWRMVAINTGLGLVVLLAGLFVWGGDGHMQTYASLVLAMGSLQWWMARR